MSTETTESEKRRMAASVILFRALYMIIELVKELPVAFPKMGLPSDLVYGALLSKVAALQIALTATTCNMLPAVLSGFGIVIDSESTVVSKMARLSTCMMSCVKVPVLS